VDYPYDRLMASLIFLLCEFIEIVFAELMLIGDLFVTNV
jgi:hypothetical protein